MFEAMNITKDSQQKAMLLHYVGEETSDILEMLNVPEPTEGSDVFKICVKALAEYFEPQKCIDHHRLCISTTNIEVRLRQKSIEQSLTLENVLKTTQAMETANEHTSEMEKLQSNAVGKYNPTKFTKSKKDPNQRRVPHKTKCGLCGGNYPHRVNQFKPPVGKEHAKTVTAENHSSEVSRIEKSDSDNSEEYTFTTGAQIVVVPKPHKPNEIRICVDMRALNKAIIQERHIIPTIDDVVHDLKKKVSDAIRGISCVNDIRDDIYIGGIDNDDHDLQGNGLTINLPKCQFQCRFTVEYRPGISNPADYSSRHPMGDPESQKYEDEAEEHIAFVAKNAVPKAVTLSEIESVVANDPTLQVVMSAVMSGCWHKAPPNVSLSELSRYEKVKEQLTCTESLLLKADRIIVPASLQE
ncbi:Hypothetical predicted protein [Paramuricea clavata]|uniref:Uncharacterized protein n=1 Tax=Paramuricea clavata TaxID=317549 RepID=A0A6S7FZ42_PARCT|nr:Hypothetical predicted protein [Paramuricea clavata]